MRISSLLNQYRRVFFVLPAALCLMDPASAAAASQLYLGSGGDYTVRGKTLADTRFRNVVKQRYDFSCGSAAVATLLTYHYDLPMDEKDVLKAMYMDGDQEKIRREGFSLLDMKNYLESIGYKAAGYRESLDKLMAVGIPAIVLINKKGYMHFVVVNGVSKDRVAVGDPTLGLRIYSRDEFEKMWNGILFVVLDNKSIAQASFNTRAAWKPHGSADLRNMLDREQLGSVALDVSLTPNYY